MAQDSIRLIDGATDIQSAALLANSNKETDVYQLIPKSDTDTWLHLEVKSPDTDLLYFPSHSVMAYTVYSADTLEVIETFNSPHTSSDYIDWNPGAQIPLSVSWDSDLIFQIQFRESNDVDFQLVSFEHYQEITSSQLLNSGMLYGAMTLMTAFCLFLYAFNNEKHALRLGLSLFAWLLAMFTIWGYGTVELPFGLSRTLPTVTNQAVVLAALSSSWFSINFLYKAIRHTLLYPALKLSIGASAGYLGFALLVEVNWSVSIGLLVLSSMIGLMTNIVAVRAGDKAASFLLASSALSSAPFFFIYFSPLSQQIVIAIGMAALAFAMLAIMQRMAEKFHSLSLKAELAGERERFLASMSHEIRTPLNGIIGFSELANQEKLDGKLKTYFNQIDRSSKMLMGIVNEVLDYAKLQADAVEMNLESMDIRHTLEDVIAINHSVAAKNSISLSYDIDQDVPPYIITDTHRCAQILVNLCGNAVKFSKNGQVTIKVSRSNDNVLFNVIDEGIGIDDDVLAGLFNPFSQADASTARQFGGTGLGLAISKQLSELLGGSISAVSAAGVGSTFTFQLPLIEGKAPAPRTEFNAESLRGKRVLLAEDNVVNMMLATQILENYGMKPDPAVDGKVALDKATENEYDFILMDMQMPVMSGTQATEEIRKRGFASPIIAMTANASESDRQACLLAGMNDFLAKPIEQQQLLSKLEQWASHKKDDISQNPPQLQ